MGPPLIGYISQMAGLRYSFAVIGIFGMGISLLVSRIKALQDTEPVILEQEEDSELLIPL
jgi:predicted MFS family arabinose efflux permease